MPTIFIYWEEPQDRRWVQPETTTIAELNPGDDGLTWAKLMMPLKVSAKTARRLHGGKIEFRVDRSYGLKSVRETNKLTLIRGLRPWRSVKLSDSAPKWLKEGELAAAVEALATGRE